MGAFRSSRYVPRPNLHRSPEDRVVLPTVAVAPDWLRVYLDAPR